MPARRWKKRRRSRVGDLRATAPQHMVAATAAHLNCPASCSSFNADASLKETAGLGMV